MPIVMTMLSMCDAIYLPEGRIQSREYINRLSDTESEKRVAYEVSISTLEVTN